MSLLGARRQSETHVATVRIFSRVRQPSRYTFGAILSRARLPVTALVDQFYADVQRMGGNRWDTSSLIHLLAKD